LSRSWEELIRSLMRRGILNTPSVIRAFEKVPRHLFLPHIQRSYASVDSPLSIGSGQTVSAPHG
jgi:protein-L-isoaspartate(D-aspartate) O-methyltransferase